MPDETLSYVGGSRRDDSFPAPYLCLALECEQPLAPPLRLSIAEVDEVEIGRGERAALRTSDGVPRLRLAVADGWMSTRHARLGRDRGAWRLVDLDSKNGVRVAGRAVREAILADGDLLEIGATCFVFRDRARRGFREPADVDGGALAAGHPAFATLSIEWARTLGELSRIAASRVPIVLHGESGTGKEVLARAIHQRSGRGPFIALNCGALPEALVEGELFGHRRGAFSGAVEERVGLVRAAHGGTLFLDEIAELPLTSQVKLLRVLQEGEVTPLGATSPIAVDLRVVSASHRALPDEVAAGRFRADLLARLAGHALALPPLRERREDLGLLIAALLRRHLGEASGRVRIDRDAARQLFRHGWPLNVRELEQALLAALALATDGRIGLAQLPAAVRAAGEARAAGEVDADVALREELTRSFAAHRGNLSAVARELGKERVQIRRWCKRLGIDAKRFR